MREQDDLPISSAGAAVEQTPGDRLRGARQRSGRSVSQLARELSCAGSVVRAHENGQNGIPPERARSYANVLGIMPEWLLFGVADNEQYLRQLIFAGLSERGHHVHGFTADKAVFHLIDQLSARVSELEARHSPSQGKRLELVR